MSNIHIHTDVDHQFSYDTGHVLIACVAHQISKSHTLVDMQHTTAGLLRIEALRCLPLVMDHGADGMVPPTRYLPLADGSWHLSELFGRIQLNTNQFVMGWIQSECIGFAKLSLGWH